MCEKRSFWVLTQCCVSFPLLFVFFRCPTCRVTFDDRDLLGDKRALFKMGDLEIACPLGMQCYFLNSCFVFGAL